MAQAIRGCHLSPVHLPNRLVVLALVFVTACASQPDSGGDSWTPPTGEELYRSALDHWPLEIDLAVRDLEAAAALGYAPAYKRLAELYLYGQGVAVDEAEAVRWLTHSADAGDLESRYSLGYMIYTGRGAEQDSAQAAYHWRIAGNAGHADSLANLGTLYFYGDGVDEDRVEATRLFGLAAREGSCEGRLKLAVAYKHGFGTTCDERAALQWMHAAAACGSVEAKFQLGAFREGGVGAAADPVDAALWYARAAADEHPQAQPEFERLDRSLRAAEARDEAVGHRYLALVHAEGLGVPVDPHRAVQHLQRAVAQDDAAALMALAQCLAEGRGIAEDDAAAFEACRRAADLGDLSALYECGVLHDLAGDYSAESHARAAACFARAAAGGHPAAAVHVELEPTYQRALAGVVDSQLTVGLFFQRNETVRRDYEQSVHWLRRAVEQYSWEAEVELGFLYARGGDTVCLLGRRHHAPDAVAAVPLLEPAARSGTNIAARTQLALLHADRNSGVYDLQRAMDWVDLAAARGDSSAVPVVQAAYDAAQRESRRVTEWVPPRNDPMTPPVCGGCGGSGQQLQTRGHYVNGHYWPDTFEPCRFCRGTGLLYH
jgi:TPR repeat protein